MSGNISSNVTAGYTEVDLSKKKNRNRAKSHDQKISNEVSMYDVLQREIPLPEALSVSQPKSSRGGSFKSSASIFVKVGLAVTAFLVIMAIVAFTVLIIILFIKVSALEAAESNSSITKNNEALQKYFDSFDYMNSALDFLQQQLTNDSTSYQQNFSIFENIYGEIATLNSSVQNVVNNLKNALNPIISYNQTCAEIAKSRNGYSSGDYILKLFTEAIRTVYCDMTSTLGGSTSGWMRIAKLDVNNCPQGFNTTMYDSVNICIRSESNAGCTEIHYSTHNVRYNNISGAVRALAIEKLDGFKNAAGNTFRSNNANLNSNYLDGVSVSSNNEHVWSFAAGCLCDEDNRSDDNNNPNKPIFVGNDYTCSNFRELWMSKQQCGSDSSWFFKMLPTTTSDITVRVCRDQASSDEDIALTELELYIQ